VSLSVDRLNKALLALFSTPERISTHRQAGKLLAEAYHLYAREAHDVSGDSPTNLTSQKFQECLFFDIRMTSENFAAQVDRAFMTYWMGATFQTLFPPSTGSACPSVGGTGVFTVETTSQVTQVVVGAMRAALLPVLMVSGRSAQSKALQTAIAMHYATRTAVTVKIVGLDTTLPPAGPVPIINTCGVF